MESSKPNVRKLHFHRVYFIVVVVLYMFHNTQSPIGYTNHHKNHNGRP